MCRLFVRRPGRLATPLALSMWGALVNPSGGAAQEGALEPVRAQPITIAVVEDGPSPGDTVLASIEREVTAILAARGERAWSSPGREPPTVTGHAWGAS